MEGDKSEDQSERAGIVKVDKGDDGGSIQAR
jgi:hypothetical protein